MGEPIVDGGLLFDVGELTIDVGGPTVDVGDRLLMWGNSERECWYKFFVSYSNDFQILVNTSSWLFREIQKVNIKIDIQPVL